MLFQNYDLDKKAKEHGPLLLNKKLAFFKDSIFHRTRCNTEVKHRRVWKKKKGRQTSFIFQWRVFVAWPAMQRSHCADIQDPKNYVESLTEAKNSVRFWIVLEDGERIRVSLSLLTKSVLFIEICIRGKFCAEHQVESNGYKFNIICKGLFYRRVIWGLSYSWKMSIKMVWRSVCNSMKSEK